MRYRSFRSAQTPAPSITPAVTKPMDTFPSAPIVRSWYARKNAMPSTSSTMPSLFNQSVPNTSSISSDDRKRSNMVGVDSEEVKVGGGTGGAADTGEIGVGGTAGFGGAGKG